MKKHKAPILIVLFLFASGSGHADPWADSVVAFIPGPGAGFGQEYFPQNVLGPPDTSATPIVPSSSPQELLALGYAGSIILEFSDNVIVDLPGVDFTVFENPFWIGGNPENPFVEAGIVAISADGINWIEFPYDTATYEGLAGVTPTNGWADPTDPGVSGGDSFDLFDLGLDTVRFVRVTDAGDRVPDLGPSFDLDAIVAVHSGDASEVIGPSRDWGIPRDYALSAFPNPFNPSTTVTLLLEKPGYLALGLYNSAGQRVLELVPGQLAAGMHQFRLDAGNSSSGSYLLRAEMENGSSATQRLILLR